MQAVRSSAETIPAYAAMQAGQPLRAFRYALEFSARHQIVPRVEVFPMEEVNDVLKRLAANELRYRAVLTNELN